MDAVDVHHSCEACEAAVEQSLTAALETVREAARRHMNAVVALRCQLMSTQQRCGVLAAELADSHERVRVLEEELSSYRRVSRLIALENENARLRKKVGEDVLK